MIDEYNHDRTGFARFDGARRKRYMLRRSLNGRPLEQVCGQPATVWIMLNPSTADAFKSDPTINRCVMFSQRLGADVLEVVNLFAFVSPRPRDLRIATDRGDGPDNDAVILAACAGASRVIAAWGTGGDYLDRASIVRARLAAADVRLHVLGLTSEGHPKHPLARGKHRVPDDVEPMEWA